MPSTDFVKFNAYSIKDLINQKLAQDTNFTDQIYEGSNLATLIDIFSYIAHSLLYCLNNAAAESMFADTQMYENMNRLCRFIGYNPRGMSPSTARFLPYSESQSAEALSAFTEYLSTHRNILKYSYVDTGKTDSNGKTIYYSVGDEDVSDIEYNTTNDYEFRMYNGIWRMYNTVFTATGSEWETFTLTGLRSDNSTNEYIAHGFINVFAVLYDGQRIRKFYKFKPTLQQLFKVPILEESEPSGFSTPKNILFTGDLAIGELQNAQDSYDKAVKGGFIPDKTIFDKRSHVFNVRLNENKEYQITFGDGSTGARLPEGASVYVVYLDTNGEEADISPREVVAPLQPNTFSANSELYNAILLGSDDQMGNAVLNTFYTGYVTNISPSTNAVLEESVDDIRDNAPNWFKMGNRLVTHGDYEYYLKNHPYFRGLYSDVKCMNNWEYVASFYKWLYNLGIRKYGNPRQFLNQNRLVKNDFQIADPADCNNIYLWVIENSASTASTARDDVRISETSTDTWTMLKSIKDLTHEPILLRAIPVDFKICAAPANDVVNALENFSDEETKEFFKQSYLEVTLDDDALYSSSSVAVQVASRFITYFETSRRLGQIVNFNDLLNMILDIEGVNRVRTLYIPKDDMGNLDPNSAIIYNGICMASYTVGLDNLIDIGVDIEVSNSSRSLEAFQYAAYIDNTTVVDSIKVIKKSLTSMNKVQY